MKVPTSWAIYIICFSAFLTYCWYTRHDAYNRGYKMATGFDSPEARQHYIDSSINAAISHSADSIIANRLKQWK